jgi:hypothetical protein
MGNIQCVLPKKWKHSGAVHAAHCRALLPQLHRYPWVPAQHMHAQMKSEHSTALQTHRRHGRTLAVHFVPVQEPLQQGMIVRVRASVGVCVQ